MFINMAIAGLKGFPSTLTIQILKRKNVKPKVISELTRKLKNEKNEQINSKNKIALLMRTLSLKLGDDLSHPW